MNELKVFKNEEFGNIRIIVMDGVEWFVAKEISEKLGYTTLQKMYSHIEEIDKIKINPQSIDYQGLCQNGINLVDNENTFNLVLINESGLYDAIFGSKLSSAKKFKRWVTKEVLPSIRKHGAYMSSDVIEKTLTDPNFIIQLATQFKEEKEARKIAEEAKIAAENKNKELEVIIEENKPKQITYDAFFSSGMLIDVTDYANMLDIDFFGRNKVFAWLKSNKYLRPGNAPYRKYIDSNIFKSIPTPCRDGRVRNKTYITGKGANYILKKIVKDFGFKREIVSDELLDYLMSEYSGKFGKTNFEIELMLLKPDKFTDNWQDVENMLIGETYETNDTYENMAVEAMDVIENYS